MRGRGSDLGIEVAGPDLVACLDAAVQGLADAVGAVADEAPRRTVPVEVEAGEPADLLVGVLEEAIVLLDTDGVLATGLVDATADDAGVQGGLEVVDLESVSVHGPAPKAVTWHGVRLDRTAEGWAGAVMVDL